MVLPPQLLPAVTLGFVGVPAVHTSAVQTLLSTGRSRSSFTVVAPPCPLHTFFVQSRGVCAATSVPVARLGTPQATDTQLRVWHAASVPGQVLAERHATHLDALSHTRPLPQPIPEATGR